MKKILLVLLLPIIKLSEKEGIKINNIDTDYLKVTIFNNCDYELSIKNQYDYKYIIYKNINDIDIDTLQENTFYIFIMYTNNKPSSRFISISNNYNELYSLKKDNNSFLLKKNENSLSKNIKKLIFTKITIIVKQNFLITSYYQRNLFIK